MTDHAEEVRKALHGLPHTQMHLDALLVERDSYRDALKRIEAGNLEHREPGGKVWYQGLEVDSVRVYPKTAAEEAREALANGGKQ